jgi:hypothetical protein
LGRQGVGGEGLGGDVEGFQQRDDPPDLVGLFERVAAVYGQGADDTEPFVVGSMLSVPAL